MENSYSQLMQALITSTKYIFPNNKVIRKVLGKNEPDAPYVALQVIREVQIGAGTTSTLVDTEGNISVLVPYEALVQFSFISKDEEAASNMARHFIQFMNTPKVKNIFRSNNLSQKGMSSLRNVASLREGEWVQHQNVDVTFTYSSLTTQQQDIINSIEIVDEITGEVITIPPEVIIP